MVQKLLHPYSPYHPSGAVSGAACCREKPVDAGGAFCYNVKAINGAVLKWSKRRDSKSRRPRKGCQGSNPCCSAKPNGQMNFIRLSILFFVFQLNTLMVIKVDIIVNHFISLFKSLWFVSVDALSFQDAKEIFSQRIVIAISTP